MVQLKVYVFWPMDYEQVYDFKWELIIFRRVCTVWCHPCSLLLVDVLSNSRFIAEIEWKFGKILVIHTNKYEL